MLTLGSGIGTAAEIFVQSGDSIQTAVDNATSGDVIILKSGAYIENIEINKDNLVIKSESGNPEDTIIKAKSSSNHVIDLQVDNVKISGLEITGTKGRYAGIYLSGCNNCIIDNSKVLNNGYGIYILNSKENILSNNEVTNNGEYGILFSTANDNTLSGNTASYNKGRGIHIGTSDGNILSGNTISSNDIFGLFVCPRSDNNLVFNNYFNNVVNAEIKNGNGNAYNTAKTEGTNIIGGSYLAGNFWAKPDGSGFSETAVDGDGDGIADSAYEFENSIYADQLPLVPASRPQQTVLPIAVFKVNTTDGPAPLSVQFTDLSEHAAGINWDFESDGKVDSTDKNPVHVYTVPGIYTVGLTITNENGTSSKIATVTVTQAIEDKSGSSSETSNNGNNDNITANNGNGDNFAGDIGTDDNGTDSIGAGDSGSDNSEAGDSEIGDYGSSISGGNSQSNGGSSGGSSGGGMGVSLEPSRNVEAKEISQTFITGGKETKFDFTKNATCVVYVTFDAKKTVGKTTTIVEMLKGKSALVSEPPSDEVYKSFNIWVGKGGYANSRNIENPVVCFKVEKAWLQNKSIEDSITLNRYSEKKWEQLPVSLLKEDNEFLYFTAEIPGFSSFAITGKAQIEGAVTDSQPDSKPNSHSGLEIGDLAEKILTLFLSQRLKRLSREQARAYLGLK